MSQLTKREQDLSIFEQYTSEQLELIKSQIAKGATDSELALFLSICKKRELDPFSKEIWFVKYGNSKPVMTVSIDGLRSIAERTGELDGQEGPVWCSDDGVWRDVWLDSKPPSACKVTVYRKNCSRGFTSVALWKEYNNPNNPIWKKFGTVMLAKCAEAGALRKAFPQVMSGLYESSEIQDLNKTETTVEAEFTKEKPSAEDKFNIQKHKDFLLTMIKKYGVDADTIPPTDKSNLVVSLSNVDLLDAADIIKDFCENFGGKDETN